MPGAADWLTSLLVLRLLVDTSVWLDTAKDIRGERLVAAVRMLVHQHQLELLVPQVVIDEYDRNRGHVVASLSASTRAHVRTVRAALAEHGRSERNHELLEELDEVAVRGPLIEQLVVNRFTEVRDLLEAGRSVAPDDETLQRVVRRGLQKKAPFHHAKNSVADAVLIETYRTVTAVRWRTPLTTTGSSPTTPRTSRTRRTTAGRTRTCRAASPAHTPATSRGWRTPSRSTCPTRRSSSTSSISRSTPALARRSSRRIALVRPHLVSALHEQHGPGR